MSKRKTEADVSADIREAAVHNGLNYRHVEMRPWRSMASVVGDAQLVMYHPDEFDPDDVEAHDNAAKHLFKGVGAVSGIMARLPDVRVAEFTLRAAVEGFRLVDRVSSEEDGYAWLVYKR